VLRVQLPSSGDTTAGEEHEHLDLDEVQRNHILKVLEQTGWRIRGKGGTAQLLGLKPSTLESKMNKLGIRRPERS
jgi:transcriptional regulator with GAF, ATPase, and Fis domain